jgi:hypothetical protein
VKEVLDDGIRKFKEVETIYVLQSKDSTYCPIVFSSSDDADNELRKCEDDCDLGEPWLVKENWSDANDFEDQTGGIKQTSSRLGALDDDALALNEELSQIHSGLRKRSYSPS